MSICLVAGCASFKSKEVPPPQHVAATPPPVPVTAKQEAPKPPPELAGEAEALGQQPQLGPIPQFDAPVPRIEKLPNGLPVYLVERPGDGIEAVQLWIRGGATADPADMPGLCSVLAALMETGAAGRSQTQLAAAEDAIGMSLSVQATPEALVVTASAMTTQLGPMTQLFADVALKPALAADEFEKVRGQRGALLTEQKSEPQVAAGRAFRAAVFAGTPMARPIEGTLASVKAMKLADVKKLYAGFGPQRAALVAVGGAKAADVLKALKARFAAWKPAGAKKLAPLAEKAPAERPRLVEVDFPGKPQSVLVAGQPAPQRSSPDYLALETLNAVLGGSFTSRLNQNLREQHGYSYGAGSRFGWGSRLSSFAVFSSVKTDVTGAALGEVLKELQGSSTLSADELTKGKALLTYALADRLSRATSLAGATGDIWLYGLPNDELKTFVPRLQALTVESVQAAAQKTLDPAHMTLTIAGDRAKVDAQLEKLNLGAPQLRDAYGELVTSSR